jgi:hypothetical protein
MTVEGYKHFIDAQSMSAFDVNAFLMSQAVTRFETAADRDAALEQVVTEGMVSYNKDTGELQLYDGSAWQTVAIGASGAAGSDGQVQYNNGGSFGGASALYYDDVNSRVGIGTTTPDSLLEIKSSRSELKISSSEGDPLTNHSGRILFENTNISDTYDAAAIEIHGGSDAQRNGSITFLTNPTGTTTPNGLLERMIIDELGNVGIGTTTPGTLLHVSSETSGDAELRISADTDNNNEGDLPYLSLTADGGIIEGVVGLNDNTLVISNGVSSGQGIDFRTGTSNVYTTAADQVASTASRLFIDSSGNVGIGTTAPDNKIHVQRGGSSAPASVPTSHMIIADSGDSSGSGIGIYTPTNGFGYIRFGDPDNGARGGLAYGHAADKLFLRAGGTDSMTIDSAGNVGINDTTPSYTLDVNGTGRFTGTLTLNGDLIGTSDTNFVVGNDSNERILFQESSNQIFFRTNGTDRCYISSSGHFLPYATGSYTLGSSSLRWGYLYANSVNCSGLIDVNWVRNTNGNFLALEGGDAWDLGNNASGEYVWVAAEGGLIIVSSDANSTVWANRNQIRITPEGGIDQRLRIHGGLEVEGPDGGMVMRYWQANSGYGMIGTANMASSEYALLTDGLNTFISAGAGGTVHIRGPNNDSSPQITNNGTNVSISGTCLFTDIDISGTARANEFRADDYGPANDASFTFISDEDTGVYRHTTNQLGLTAGGSAGIIVASGTCATASLATSTTSGYQYVLRNNTYGTLYRYSSTIELKEQVADFDGSGDLIDALRPVTFVPKFVAGQPTPDDEDDEFDPTVETDSQRTIREADLQYGFIAEEVATVGDGKLAQYEWTENGQLRAMGWKWPDMIAVLVAEVKSLRARVTTLETT